MCTSGDKSTSGLAAAILHLSLLVRSDSIVGITVGLLNSKNKGSAVKIALVLCIQLEFPMKKSLLYLLMKMVHHLTFHL